jgi:hypothetical protein
MLKSKVSLISKRSLVLGLIGALAAGASLPAHGATKSYANDHSPPQITLGTQSNQSTRTKAFKVPVTVQDASPVTTVVLLNGTQVTSSTKASFTATVTLVEGANSIEVRSTDANQNQAQPAVLSGIVLDTTPPVISVQNPGNADGAFGSWTVPVQGSSNEKLGAVTVNGAALTVSSDGLTFSGNATATKDGNFTVKVTATDVVGNSATNSQVVKLDTKPPVVTLGKPPALTRTAAYSLPIRFTDSSPVTVKVKVNGADAGSTTTTPSTVALTLSEGANTIEVSAADSLGNAAAPITLAPVILDATAPILSSIVPLSGAVIGSLTIPVAGKSNEPLSAVNVNGQKMTLSADRLSFSGNRKMADSGAFTLSFQATDLAGNISTQDVPIIVDVKPVITIGIADHILTKTPVLLVPVQVLSATPATTTVFRNGVQVFQSTQGTFQAPVTLSEGPNRIEVQSWPISQELTPTFSLN